MSVSRVLVTEAAAVLIASLVKEHGALLFHQSGGCCDGSAPMCFPRNEFRLGLRDVHMGDIVNTPFYMGGAQFELWKHTQLTIDVVAGRGAGFSLEAPRGVRFMTRSRVFEDWEVEWLESQATDRDAEVKAHSRPSAATARSQSS